MVNLSEPITQKAYFTGKSTELLVVYDVIEENRAYDYDNVIFGYSTNGKKQIEIPSLPTIDLRPEMVIMSSTKLTAQVSVPEATIETPSLCFCLEVSKEKVWKILDRINDAYSMPKLVSQEQNLSLASVYEHKSSQLLLDTLYKIQHLLMEEVAFKDYWIDLKIEELILICLQTDMRNLLIHSYQKNQLEDHPLASAVHHVKENLYSKIDMSTLSDKAFMSKATFFRQFKHHFGMTPVTFIHTERIKEAQKLLKRTNKSISDIGYQLGYASPSYFTSQFERFAGCSPTAYRSRN